MSTDSDFDLCTTLGRENGDYTQDAAFFDAMRQDPVMAQVKLIAEPWDVGPFGYQLGNFPPGWAEWNGQYRDGVRRFWKGDKGLVAEMASRLAGSSDIFGYRGRRPWASINFITAHDGYTLQDLVSYEQKHNEANGEDNRDGHDANFSFNGGVEGPTDEPAIVAFRDRQKRNFMATLLLSLGVPMLLAGDEFGHTQHGNNNAYCQDNEIAWLDWENLRPEDAALRDFVRYLIRFRREHRVFSRPRFFRGEMLSEAGLKDITWVTPAGIEATGEDWGNPVGAVARLRAVRRRRGILYAGRAARHRRKLSGDDERLSRRSRFSLPRLPTPLVWEAVVDTAEPTGLRRAGAYLETGRSVSAAGAFVRAVHQPRAEPGARTVEWRRGGRYRVRRPASDPLRSRGPVMRRHHALPFGAEIVPGGVRFRLWAPRATNRVSGSGRQRGGGTGHDAGRAGGLVVGHDRPGRRGVALSLPRGRRRLSRPGLALSAGRRARRQRGDRPRRLPVVAIPAGAEFNGKRWSSTSCIWVRFRRAAISPERSRGSTIWSSSAFQRWS